MMGFGLGMGAPFQRTALFRAFRAAVGTYVAIPAWTASGDFRARFLLVIPATDGIYRFASGSDAMARFGINVVGGVGSVVTAQIDGAWESANNKSLPTGQLTLFEYERINSVFTIRVNSVEKHTSTSSVAPVMLDQLFVDNNGISNHFDGYALLAYLQDLSTPSNSRRYSRFCEPGGIVPNDLGAFGAELCDFANLASQGVGWTFDGAIKKHADDSSTFDLGVDVDAGTRYRLQYKKRNHTAGDPSWKVGGISQSGVMPQMRLSDGSEGGATFLFVPTVSGRLGIGATIGRLEIESLSVREDSDSGQLYNPADGSIQRHTKKSGYWLGPELWQEDSLENFGASSRIASISFDGNSNTLTSAAASGEFWVRKASHSDLGGAVVECEAKAGVSDYILLRLAEDKFAVFDLAAGSALTTDGVDAFISVGADGWAKCKVRSEGAVSYPAIGMSDGSLLLTPTLPAGHTVQVRNPRLYPLIPIAPGVAS